MTGTREGKPRDRKGLSPSHWIAIATVSVAVLIGVLGSALSEHNTRLNENTARLANVEAEKKNRVDAQARIEGAMATSNDRLERIETKIERLIRMHVDAGGAQPSTARTE